MPTWTRGKALLTMTSPLGEDALIPLSLNAEEAISLPFQFDLRAVSQQGIIDPNKLLNQPACVTLRSSAGPIRFFHGIVRHVSAEGLVRGLKAGEYHEYDLILVPRLWFLTQTVDCRVYQNLSVAEILKSLFTDAGLASADYVLPQGGAKREYTVQFNESDLHFATRLMEEEGWFYFFEHSASAHKLIVADRNAAFKDIAGAELHMRGGDSDAGLITDWSRPTRTARGKMSLKDYDPEKPDAALQAGTPTTLATAGANKRDDFRWPALSVQNEAVNNRAKWEMEAAEAAVSLFSGASRFGKLVPGGKFKLTDRPATSYDGVYVVQSVSHHASDDTWLNAGGQATYENRFSCFQSATTWRQPMATPRPRMDGIHTALVLGPGTEAGQQPKVQSGEEVHTDELARVKVRFFWDHRGEATGGGACWARVVQPWAGNGWGAQFIPRVGTEVAVAFVDADPDRPIVIGGLYNGTQSPIYPQAEKTKSGWRTRSSLSGGSADCSEFTFDDKKGSELVFLHAQKDLTTEVEHDQTLKVDNCRIVTVGKDETVHIKNDRSSKIDNNDQLTIGNQQTIKVQAGRDVTISSGGDKLTVQAGDLAINVSTGAVKVQAMQSIELSVGANSVKIDQTGVAVSAMMVKIAGQTMLDLNAPMSKLNGDGMLMLKGGLMMLN